MVYQDLLRNPGKLPGKFTGKLLGNPRDFPANSWEVYQEITRKFLWLNNFPRYFPVIEIPVFPGKFPGKNSVYLFSPGTSHIYSSLQRVTPLDEIFGVTSEETWMQVC